MDRRDFFKSAFRKTTEKVVEHADNHAKKQASRWIRPPYAISELDFLLACTRCNDCIDACPHQVIFPLSAKLGAKVVGTPALDLVNKACHLCADWPCVSACNENAMILSEPDSQTDVVPPPKMALAFIDTDNCFPYSGPECGACDCCPVPGALLWDQQRPVIDPEHCIGCGLCRHSCVVQPSAIGLKSCFVE